MPTASLTLRTLAAAALLSIAAAAASAQPAPPPAIQLEAGQGAYLVLTDIHFDPFSDRGLVAELAAAAVEDWRAILERGAPGLSPFGRDTDYGLLKSALDAAAGTGTAYDFVLIAGDFLAHNFSQNYATATGGTAGYAGFVEKTMVFVARLVQERFPDVAVIGTFGNNDSTCGDYAVSPKSTLFPKLAEEWAVLKSNPQAAADFRLGGSFWVPHPTVPGQRIVVVNDIYWSAKYKDCDPTGNDAGSPMLAWLEWHLFAAMQAGERVTLMFHIPPGIDGYASAHGRGSCAADTTPFWEKVDTDRFLEIVDRYRSVLAPAVAGHTHMDEFRVVASAEGQPLLPIKIFPSISPIFGNAPAFTVVAYDTAGGGMRDYTVYGLANLADAAPAPTAAPDWRLEYRFGETYRQTAFDAASAGALAAAIRDDTTVRETFTRFYAGIGARSQPISQANWRAFSCAQTEIQPPAYTACSCTAPN